MANASLCDATMQPAAPAIRRAEAGVQRGEFALIRRLGRPGGSGVVLGIGDDAALLRPRAGSVLAACVDTLVEGVHFPPGTAWADLGWKALAVNLSDLAAMGAVPCWATLALTLPDGDPAAFAGIVRGLRHLGALHGVALVGGDTTRGPLSLTVQALGQVPLRRALRREGARAGDGVWVSGHLGDAAAGLAIVQGRQAAASPADARRLRGRLDRPTPRVALGIALRGVASACIDVSDGLAQDLGHVLRASGAGAAIAVDALPLSPALRRAIADPARRRELALSGGDDYELCFTVPPRREARLAAIARALRLPLARIGAVTAGRALRLRDAAGRRVALSRPGYDHFA
jgi:thiamine-monophosphate kinase